MHLNPLLLASLDQLVHDPFGFLPGHGKGTKAEREQCIHHVCRFYRLPSVAKKTKKFGGKKGVSTLRSKAASHSDGYGRSRLDYPHHLLGEVREPPPVLGVEFRQMFLIFLDIGEEHGR